MASSGKRTRGPNRGTAWVRNPDDGVSVLRLALDTSDPLQRGRLEAMYQGAYQVRRAVQRRAKNACRAYWAATHERNDQGPASVRDRLGLSKTALERAAYAHLNAAPHLRRHVTKALAMNLADGVWTAAERHLFRDASGNRHGALRIGRWYDFTRLPGRARSHTRERKWESFRLHGTLAGHRAAYADGSGDFVQPRALQPIDSGDAWWKYAGPLALVFSGLADGTLVLPVRLPTSPCNQPILDHHLTDPSRWHKIDVVRTQDPQSPGGWRYEAHLMVLTQPYVSGSTAERRARSAIETADRTVGIDVNVSNLSIASHDTGRDMRLSRVVRDEPQQQRDRGRARRERRRQRALDRSRRALNRQHYKLSRRQDKRARRRAEAGLRPVEVVPAGPRLARTDGVPLTSYRADQLSTRYRRLRAAQVACAASATQARRDRAREVAAGVVAAHGYQIVIEDVRLPAWSASWGRAVAAFSPGTLIAAIDHEARAVGVRAGGSGGIERASTATTALSQHCPCGERVPKRLADRVHACPRCRLRGDRDDVSAILASFVVLTERGVPASARVDYPAAHDALGEIRRALRSAASTYHGWARHPVRVNRPLGPRWIVRRVVDAHTRLRRGGSANRWHGRVFNPA
ncbi:MAG: transposase [Deltaproteobacteria bacterium]|nr:transposase [Deltaproteobacteria bacterium]